MISSASSFVESSIAVSHNVIKSILFRLAGFLLQAAVLQFFALLASTCKAFTAYLMFAEDYIQKALFMISSGFTKNVAIVLSFAVLLISAELYDTLLWGLDAPGFTMKRNNVTASVIKDQLLEAPDYVVFSSGRQIHNGSLDKITEAMGENLFKAGVNFTLIGEVHTGPPRTVPATRPFAPN